MERRVRELLSFIESSPSSFHVMRMVLEELMKSTLRMDF